MRVGEVIAERFVLQRIAGEGGMGTVFEAHDREANGPVALKVLQGRLGGEGGKRFTREARVLSTLSHPGIVQHVAHGLTDAGEMWLAMEWLAGEDLSQRLDRGGGDARPGLTESLHLVRRVAEALGVAHERGIVHRDVKPGNLFLPGGDLSRVKLLDFGLARRTAGTQMTVTGMVIGTPSYMAPEQARGERAIDARADVYALGCVLFELLTGRPPFVGEHGLAVLMKTLLEEPARLNELRAADPVPPGVDELTARLLAKDPADRPADGRAVAAELEGLLAAGVVDSAAPARKQAATVLTGSERRFVSLVAAGGRGLAATAQMAAPVARTLIGFAAPPQDVDAVALQFGVRLERMADGTLVALIAGEGLPTEHAARAARFALALGQAMSGSPLAVATGRTLAEGGVAAVPVGEVIERAVETLYGAAGGVIRIDEVTARLLPARFEVERGEGGLRLVGEREDAEGVRVLLGRPTPCVGRGRELSQIGAVWSWCCEEPGAGAVLVTAAAGVGKSRVLHEFVAGIEAGADDVLVLSGRADALGAGAAYGVLGAAIRRWAGVHADQTLQTRRELLLAKLGARLEASTAQRVAEFLGEVASIPFDAAESVQLRAARGDGRLRADQIRAAWLTWLAAECALHPVLLVLEDLHWGDRPSLQLVDVALDAVGEASLMVLATARPDVHARFPGMWADRDVTEIKLGGLSRRASEQLVRHVLGAAVAEADVMRLVRQADGNAFYLEELIRAAAQGDPEALPESVLGMVEARLAALEPDARRVLRAASVFGTRFDAAGVELLVGGEGASDVGEWLAELADRELVAGAGDAGPSRGFTFRSALVREAAYAMLTDDDRALGHRLAADFLEPLGGVDAVTLAAHRRRADQPAEAARWYVQAARDELHANDFAGAMARVAEAMACAPTGETLGAARLLEAEATMYRGDIPASVRAARDAMEAVRADSGSWSQALGYLIYGLSVLGRDAEIEPYLPRLVEATPKDADALLAVVIAQCQAAYSLQQRGHYAEALEFTQRAEAVAGGASRDEPLVVGRVSALRAFLEVHEGDLPEAVRRYSEAAHAYTRVGYSRRACGMRISLGFTYLQMGAYDEARTELLRAIVQAEKLGLGHVAATARHNLGLVLARTGEGAAALRVEREALAALEAEGDVRLAGTARCYLAQILAAAGAAGEAEAEARAAVAALDAFPPLLAQALAVLARLLLDRGAVAQARAEAQRGLALLDALGQVEEGEALLRLVAAEALAASGEHQAARAAIGVARDRILERAARLSDEAYRGQFLVMVPENARTLELAAQWEA